MDMPPPRRGPVLRARVVLLCGPREDRWVLLAYHRRGQGGFWCFPGGGVEPGESAADAACREALEETGLTVTLQGLCHVQDRPGQDAVDLFFLARIAGGALRLGSDPERGPDEGPVLAELRWVPLASLGAWGVRPQSLGAALAVGVLPVLALPAPD